MARKPAVFGGLAVLSLLAVAAAVIARPWEAGLLALILFAIWVVAAAIWLDRRDARREAVRLANQDHRPAPSLPEEAEAFLAALDGQLGLPGDLRAEVRAELSAHFEDSIAAIEAEGNDRDLAAREAVARMGRPDELTRGCVAPTRPTGGFLPGPREACSRPASVLCGAISSACS